MLLPNSFFPVEEVYRTSNLYEQSFSHVVILRQDQKHLQALTLYRDRYTTLRFAFIKRDYAGSDTPYDLTGITEVRLILKTRPLYNQALGTSEYDEEMSVEIPRDLGLAYLPVLGYDLPEAGEYFAEVQLVSDLGDFTFYKFVVRIEDI
jgi:hypothetical protein